MMLIALACGLTQPAEPAQAPFRLTSVATVPQPTAVVVPPAGPDGIYVVEQAGRVWRLPPGGGAPTLVVDLTGRVTAGGERGLLGLVFAPGYPQDPRAIVNYTFEAGEQLRTRISAFSVSPDGATFHPASEVELLAFDQPYSNHNSGALAVGPDGMLYIGVGDGGNGGDPEGHGQDLRDWLGSILRVDVRPGAATPYVVPPDNPFVGRAGAAPEIWAYGVRNPWGMHFDGATLWFADVGQDRWEEVNRGVAGGNYGWNVMEANHCYRAATCDAAGFVAPVAEYSHELGASVTGGVVYRGPSIPALDGRYLYADFAAGRFWAVPTTGGASTFLVDTDINPSTFGVDRAGRVYVGDYQGTIWRIDP